MHVASLVISVALVFTVMGQTASADTLHGYCFGTGNTCSDNGTNTPESLDPPQFGFHGSGGTESGDFWLIFLLPTSASNPASIGVTGNVAGTASQLSGKFNSGQLDSFLGISGSPTNPIGSFGAGGFSSYQVYKFDLGVQTVTGSIGPQETTSIGLPTDSYVVAFLLATGDSKWSATANSGAILETGTPGTTKGGPGDVPEPTSLVLLGTGIIGAAGAIRRRITTRRA